MGSSVENEGVQSGLGTWKHEREISKFKSQEFRGIKITGGAPGFGLGFGMVQMGGGDSHQLAASVICMRTVVT